EEDADHPPDRQQDRAQDRGDGGHRRRLGTPELRRPVEIEEDAGQEEKRQRRRDAVPDEIGHVVVRDTQALGLLRGPLADRDPRRCEQPDHGLDALARAYLLWRHLCHRPTPSLSPYARLAGWRRPASRSTTARGACCPLSAPKRLSTPGMTMRRSFSIAETAAF